MATEKPSVIDNESQDSAVLALQPPGSTVAQGNEFTPRACLALLGAFAVLFCTVGFANAFGVFQEYYSLNFLVNESQSNLSWLGSINVFCVFAGTVASGILHDKYGPRVCLNSAVMNHHCLWRLTGYIAIDMLRIATYPTWNFHDLAML